MGCNSEISSTPEVNIDATVETRLAQELLEENEHEPTFTPILYQRLHRFLYQRLPIPVPTSTPIPKPTPASGLTIR